MVTTNFKIVLLYVHLELFREIKLFIITLFFLFSHIHIFLSSAQLAASRIDQRASCAGLEGAGRQARKPPPLLRSRTLPAIVVPGVNILQAQIGNYGKGLEFENFLPY